MTSERDSRFKIQDSLNAVKYDEIQLSNDSDAMYSGWKHYLYYYLSIFMCPYTYLLTYIHRITSALVTGLCSSFLTFQRMICLPFHCFWYI